MDKPCIVQIMEDAYERIKSDVERDPKIGSYEAHITWREVLEITEYLQSIENKDVTVQIVDPRKKR